MTTGAIGARRLRCELVGRWLRVDLGERLLCGDEDDFREVGEVIAEALGAEPDLGALAARSEALCAKRPLYPGFRGYTTYAA